MKKVAPLLRPLRVEKSMKNHIPIFKKCIRRRYIMNLMPLREKTISINGFNIQAHFTLYAARALLFK